MAEAIAATAQPDEKRPDGGVAGPAVEQSSDAKSQAKKPGVVSRITGFHIWARQLSTFRNRASMPLLRRTIKNELVLNKTIISHEVIPDEIMEKTLVGHKYLCVFMFAVLCWGLLTSVKGLAAGVRYDLWLNNWLAGGLPISVLAAARIYTSWKVMRGIKGALTRRHQEKRSCSGDRP